MLIPVITFVAVAAAIFGAYWFTVGEPEAREQAQLRRRLKAEDTLRARTASVQLLKHQESLSQIGPFDQVLRSAGSAVQPLQAFLTNSGVNITVGTFLLVTATAFMAGVVGVLYYVVPLMWVGLLVGVVTACIPYGVVAYLRGRRVLKFEQQFPEAIELIGRAMRAGHAFTTGIKIAADELPLPAGPEFKLLYERQNYGAPLPDALRAFAERVPTIDARFFVTAVLTQREAGGNLSEILDRLAAVMRERFKVRQEVRTRSAHGRITAYVLAFMPPVLAALMFTTNPKHMMLLFTDPLGIRLVIAGIVLQVLGVLSVRKIIDIQY